MLQVYYLVVILTGNNMAAVGQVGPFATYRDCTNAAMSVEGLEGALIGPNVKTQCVAGSAGAPQ